MLALLEVLDRPVRKVEMQKYLFLVCDRQEKPAYDFVPHRFGCYSFQIDADKRTLTKYGLIENQSSWVLSPGSRYSHLLKQEDAKAVYDVVTECGDLRDLDLVQHVYRKHPYYAINSEIAHEVLNKRELEKVQAARPRAASARLFTIGYEGKSLERYLHELMTNQVGVLCDVRRNPVSMKYGFSKKQLKSATEAVGIHYEHIPELGIESDKRRELETPEDYAELFDEYRKTTLRTGRQSLNRIVDLIAEHGRVALTCFEAEQHECHRGCVADELLRRDDFRHRLVHL